MSFKYLKKIKTGFSNVQKKHCTRLFLIIYLFKLIVHNITVKGERLLHYALITQKVGSYLLCE